MKFFYYFGIYEFCVVVHETLKNMDNILDRAKFYSKKINEIASKTKEENVPIKSKKLERIGF